MKLKKKKPGKKRHGRKQKDNTMKKDVESRTWVDRVRFEPIQEEANNNSQEVHNCAILLPTTTTTSNDHDNNSPSSISIISWNILAASYCSRHSQRNLPPSYQSAVFTPKRRLSNIQRILQQQFSSNNNNNNNNKASPDVVCLQEVDMPEIQVAMRAAGFTDVCETERSKTGGRIAQKVDSCAIYVNNNNNNNNQEGGGCWKLVEYEQIRLDDLATLTTTTTASNDNDDIKKNNSDHCTAGNNSNNTSSSSSCIQGIQQAFLRRNMALLARLQHTLTGRTIVVANAHLYWHPAYEYVKLCQVNYILQRAQQFCNNQKKMPQEAFVLCGDLNSRPSGVTYAYLSRGFINAKRRLSPWYTQVEDPLAIIQEQETAVAAEGTSEDEDNFDDTDDDDGDTDELVQEMGQLRLDNDGMDNNLAHSIAGDKQHDNTDDDDDDAPPPQMRYLLDFTLNKFCRWLRILGQDTTLETEEEEKLRTAEGKMLLFDKCRQEQRTLVTTSTRLVQRKDCPSSVYCINAPVLPNLEVTLVHLLLTHGVVLEPEKFLTRCVVCNGSIVVVEDTAEARSILDEYQAPSSELIGVDGGCELNVYKCDCCNQGYWYSDRPNSPASRVMATTTRLFEMCLRAGIPIRGNLGVFDHVDVERERARGWDWAEKGSDLLRRPLQVVDWLKSDHLKCPFELVSAYAQQGPNGELLGEMQPFTNVTFDFVDTLDYIFYDKQRVMLTERLYVPTSFAELNPGRIQNGHLIPSRIWPSDHLAIGARLVLLPQTDASDEEPTPEESSSSLPYCLPANGIPDLPLAELASQSPSKHGRRCDCGCVPPTPSLFEMAELRRQARLKAQASTEAS